MIIALPFAGRGGESAESACDRLAASPLDQSRPPDLRGVPDDEVRRNESYRECTRAALRTREPRILFEYARVLDLYGEPAAARSFAERAAAAGYPAGQALYGIFLMNDMNDRTRNLERARTQFSRAASRGDPTGLYYLGVFSESGLGLSPPDLERAATFYEAAETAGHPSAAPALARLGARKDAAAQVTAGEDAIRDDLLGARGLDALAAGSIIDRTLKADSVIWSFRKYQDGSVRGVGARDGTYAGMPVLFLSGQFQATDGTASSAIVALKAADGGGSGSSSGIDNTAQCVIYPENPDECRVPGTFRRWGEAAPQATRFMTPTEKTEACRSKCRPTMQSCAAGSGDACAGAFGACVQACVSSF